MAKILNNIQLNRLFVKRDNMTSKISFNESYFAIVKNDMEENLDITISKNIVQMKRKLLPLEKRAISDKEKSEYKFETKLNNLINKQRMPKLAIEQTFIRQSGKKGIKIAEANKKKAFGKLREQENKLKTKWHKVIENCSDKGSSVSLAQFEKETKNQTVKLEAFIKLNKQKIVEKSVKLSDKKKIENANLLKKIDAINKKLEKLGDITQEAMLETNTVLEVCELEMHFGGVKAVDKLSFNVKEGEVFGLIGPNGAGKTTVFNCITQFNKPKGGTIYYRSKSGKIVNMMKRKVHNVINLRIARTFQNVELIWELSVLDNMLIGAQSLYHANFFDHMFHTKKLSREEKVIRARALEVLDRLNLLDYKDMIPLGLPYGILKKIELARTLMVNPRLIILDEPAAGLNEAETEELADTIFKIRKDYNCTIFLVEHDMGLVMDICDTVCAISFGKMLAIGSPDEIQTNPVVQEAYLGGTMMEEDE